VPHEPFALGSMEIVPLCDGWAPLPLEDEAPGQFVDWGAQRDLYPWAFPTDDTTSWAWHVHAFLIVHADGAVLVDTGIGDFGRAPFDVTGRLDAELAAIGVASADVQHVVLTHLHADHSGAACHADGTPRFPNARYHVHPEDWSFFATHRTPEDFTGRFAMAGLEALGALDLDPSDHEIVPGLSVHHAPGHTPGHRVVELSDAAGTLLLIGDLLHTPPQVAHPTWVSNHDEDPDLAAEHRRRWVDRAEQDRWMVCVGHFGRPFGQVVAQEWTSAELSRPGRFG
jgi:glyoxylase-like metal-dependent hydrolase (beta-lactamase superfamily II)